MKKIILPTILAMYTLILSGQGVIGSWDDHLPYSRSEGVAAGPGKIYSSTGYAVLVHDTGSGTNSSLSRISGLTETSVALVAWCEAEESLIIVYRSAGIDIVRKGVITSIPDIKNKYIPGIKEIYGANVSGSRLLLSSSFGIVVIDVRGASSRAGSRLPQSNRARRARGGLRCRTFWIFRSPGARRCESRRGMDCGILSIFQ